MTRLLSRVLIDWVRGGRAVAVARLPLPAELADQLAERGKEVEGGAVVEQRGAGHRPVRERLDLGIRDPPGGLLHGHRGRDWRPPWQSWTARGEVRPTARSRARSRPPTLCWRCRRGRLRRPHGTATRRPRPSRRKAPSMTSSAPRSAGRSRPGRGPRARRGKRNGSCPKRALISSRNMQASSALAM